MTGGPVVVRDRVIVWLGSLDARCAPGCRLLRMAPVSSAGGDTDHTGTRQRLAPKMPKLLFLLCWNFEVVAWPRPPPLFLVIMVRNDLGGGCWSFFPWSFVLSRDAQLVKPACWFDRSSSNGQG